METNNVPKGTVSPEIMDRAVKTFPGIQPPKPASQGAFDMNPGLWRSKEINEIGKALCTFQGKAASVKKEKTNPFFNSAYADINDILKSILPITSSCGLAISQGNRYDVNSNGFYVTTTLYHVSGQWIKSEVRMPIGGKKDAHAIGSAITYGRRFGLSAILGISVDSDDDGNSTVNR